VAKEVRCLVCGGGADLALELAGTAGGSARRKHDRLHQRREREVKGLLGNRLGGAYLFFKEDPQSIRAWQKGASGEERLAGFLGERLPPSVLSLHDRRIPGTRANIDHVIVAPSGVWVIDAKDYKGKVERRDVGPLWRADLRVYVGGRDRTKLVHAMPRQVEAVRNALAADPLSSDVIVRAAVCFVGSEWGLFGKPFELAGVLVTYPGKLAEAIGAPGQLTSTAVARLANRIAVGLPAA
jgi:hypothetical protein